MLVHTFEIDRCGEQSRTPSWRLDVSAPEAAAEYDRIAAVAVPWCDEEQPPTIARIQRGDDAFVVTLGQGDGRRWAAAQSRGVALISTREAVSPCALLSQVLLNGGQRCWCLGGSPSPHPHHV